LRVRHFQRCAAIVAFAMPGPVASAAAVFASGYVPYSVDPTWRPAFPQGTGTYSAVDVAGGRVYVGQRSINFSDPVLVFDLGGAFLHAFGAGEVGQGQHHDETEFGVHGVNLHVHRAETGGRDGDTIWVTDFMNHSVIAYDTDGHLLGLTGGVASADDDKFDAPSDIAFRVSSCFFVDGDGGLNMRVSRWALSDGLLARPEWQNPAERPEDRSSQTFDHPHSIAWHEASKKLIVCDRDHWRIVLMDPESGAVTGNVTCDLDLGPGTLGRPFGVRTYRQGHEDLVIVAVAGNEGIEDGHQFLHVLDGRNLAEGECQVLQSLAVDPGMCHTPHLLGLDGDSGDVYIACNQEPHSNVIRLTRSKSMVV